MQLGILGTGNMAAALVSGLIENQLLRPTQIVGYDARPAQLRAARQKFSIRGAISAMQVCQKADTILIAVKPQDFPALLSSLKPVIKNQLWISIAAGIDLKSLRRYLGTKARVIRAMPNAPASMGLGATAFTAGKNCTGQDKQVARKIFGAVGEVLEMKSEKKLDAVTGLSGSGPAYVYAFIGALIRGGMDQGLSEKESRVLALQTVIGASNVMKNSGQKAEELIAIVASKKGTTEAGLKVLKSGKLDKTVRTTVAAATRRARELRE